MDTILAHLDAIAREIAKANAGLDKLGSDMYTILERLDRVESRRNSHDSDSETLPQAINPPRPPPNDVDISQATKFPPTRGLLRSIPPPFDQVQQKVLGSQISPVQAPQPKLHFTKSVLSTETPLYQRRHVYVEENGRKEHNGYGVYADACMMWPIERGEAMNLWANSSQDGEDDTGVIMDMYLWEFILGSRLVFPPSTIAQSYKDVSLGSTLTTSDVTKFWPSPSGDFAFGFQRIRNGSSGFLLAIWFNKLEGKTIVWSANRNNIVPEGSKVELSIDGRLVLTDPNATSSSGVLWQSFDEPTDTIFPGQVLNQRSRFVSSFSRTNASSGRFELFLDGDLALYTIKYPIVYWSTTTGGSGNQRQGVACGFNSLCSMGTDRRPRCDCPIKYLLNDPKDKLGRCSRNFPEQVCKDESRGVEAFTMHEMLHTNWIGSDYEYYGDVTEYVFKFKGKYPKKLSTYQAVPGVNIRSFSYNELEEATNGFEEQLGTGAFSTGYKAVLNDDNEKIVAVMKLHKTVTEGEQGFLAEVNSIRKINHKNLVQLLGFCNEVQHRFLVYEHMETGSLADLLFKDSRLSWSQRVQVAIDTAKGLCYLHEECSTQIIHCDIMPQNVLLDEGLTAKIADFGIAKLLRKDQTQTTTKIRGTRGYVAPEWFRNMICFGILLLELICCRKSCKQDVANENEMILAVWACDCYRRKELHLLAGDDEEAVEDIEMFKKLLMVAIWCIQENPALRPSMKKVMLTLEGSVEVSIPPDPFSFICSV
ncbi:hypothetical protein CQW23_06552 [Capsicum baccatum]|uniref:non-specific serine/threonine protein kinase n=1 Tax=Capsicum baccatum TaxID=33114 RepID=A0A2G2X3Q8_CAPBA|nr:hypothetical protein CQW23_06552 [Capsicum baccatum]